MKNKITTLLLLAAFAVMINPGCSDYLDVNKNVDAPDYVDAYLYLPGILAAYQGLYWDIRALGPLTQMMGTSSYTSFAGQYYSLASDAGGEMWRTSYWLQGINLENMIKQAKEQEAWTLVGIGYAIKAFSWDAVTKYHGEIPMKDAYVPGLLAHSYDYQDEVYVQVREWAKEAISFLEMTDNFGYGTTLSNGDLMYKGDKSKWLKFAHGVIVRNLASLTNKKNFASDYASELIAHAAASLQTRDDDATIKTPGGGASVPFGEYNNFWGVQRGNLTNSYWQHDFAVQVFTGTVPKYDRLTGDKVRANPDPETGLIPSYRPFALLEKQIICDTLVDLPGHFDPRVVAKLATATDPTYQNVGNRDSVKYRRYHGASFAGSSSNTGGTAPSFYGRVNTSATATDGNGRWLYRNDAPYVLMTAAEIKFCLAEAYYKIGQTTEAFNVWKEAVALDMSFTEQHLFPGAPGTATGGALPGGDKITRPVFTALGQEYLNGPYVNNLPLSEFSLSHIMMQKWVALYPWGAAEAWVDMRKYHYDIVYSGEYPSLDNGWNRTSLVNKWDEDPTKVYKGLYMQPAQVGNRRSAYNAYNEGSPSYRVRPRYNSEYMWNKPSLDALKPISGLADNYQCSIPWFAYPGEMPK